MLRLEIFDEKECAPISVRLKRPYVLVSLPPVHCLFCAFCFISGTVGWYLMRTLVSQSASPKSLRQYTSLYIVWARLGIGKRGFLDGRCSSDLDTQRTYILPAHAYTWLHC